jgi:hypothetical protein
LVAPLAPLGVDDDDFVLYIFHLCHPSFHPSHHHLPYTPSGRNLKRPFCFVFNIGKVKTIRDIFKSFDDRLSCSGQRGLVQFQILWNNWKRTFLFPNWKCKFDVDVDTDQTYKGRLDVEASEFRCQQMCVHPFGIKTINVRSWK